MKATLGMSPAGISFVASTDSCLPVNTTVQFGAQEWLSKLAFKYTPVPKCSGVKVLRIKALISNNCIPSYLSDRKLNALTRILA